MDGGARNKTEKLEINKNSEINGKIIYRIFIPLKSAK
jgi:hypothetical protein